MKYFFIAIFMCFNLTLIAQNNFYQIKDAKTNENLTLATAENQQNQRIIPANDSAKIKLKVGQTYVISQMGYQNLLIEITDQTPSIILLKPEINILNEVLITGNRMQDPVLSTSTPNLAERVVQPKNIGDLFRDLNGFSLIKRGNYAVDPTFRASQYEQLNVQYDGGTKIVHACPSRMDPITTHVSPEEIQKIEVIKGPFSMRYGSTFGGVVNMVTKSPQHQKIGISGSVSAGYETNGDAMTTSASLNYVKDKFDISGNWGYRYFGNYEDGEGITIPSQFRSIDYGLKLGYNLTEHQRLQASWKQSFGRDVLHAGLPMDTEFDDSSIATLDYSWSQISDNINGLKAKIYYSYVDHLMSNLWRPNRGSTEAASPVESFTSGGKIELDWQLADNIRVFSGLDAYQISREGDRTRVIKKDMMGNPLPEPKVFVDQIWQDSYVNNYGFFNEAKWKLSESSLVTIGARYDYVVAETEMPEDDFAAYYPDLDKREEHNLSWTASYKTQLLENLNLELAYGRGVRSATMAERFINHFTVGSDPFEYIGNPNLDAEVNNQFEIGLSGSASLGRGFLNRLEYNFSTYYSIFDNYIVGIVDEDLDRKFMPQMEPKHPKVFQNLNDAYKTGFEASLNIDFLENYSLGMRTAYVYTKNKDLGESLPLTPPWNNRLNLSYAKGIFWADVFYNYVSKQSDIAPSFGETETPSWQTVDLKAGLRYKKYEFGVAALNVFDEAYRDHLSFSFKNQYGYNGRSIFEPGRNFTFFLKYSF
ncbi:MAG: TonB-dependent receptor [Psychroflexus halocasei]